MTDPETIRFIREEIKRQLNVILPAQTGETTDQEESIESLFPGMPTIPNRPVVQPFGISSRAPQGTQSVTARMGEHVGNRITLGHRDKDKPPVEEGETIVYNKFGVKVTLLKTGKIRIENETVELMDQLVQLLEKLIAARAVTLMGPQPFWAQTIQDLTAIKTKLEELKD